MNEKLKKIINHYGTDEQLVEIWKPVYKYENLYEVSNLGNVRSIKRKGTSGVLLKQDKRKDGYLQVHLTKNGKMKNFLVHRIVAYTFIPNNCNFPEINHINEIKADCKVNNLEWCDKKYNMNYRNRPYKNAIKVKQLDENDNLISIFNSIREAGKITNINQSHISKCCKGKIKTAGGFRWIYC